MGRLSSYSSYGEPVVEAVDPNQSGQFRSVRANQSIAGSGDFVAEDAMPLFLSGYTEETEQRGFGKAWDGSRIVSRVFKFSIFAAAAAIAAAIVSVPDQSALFENAKASLIGVLASETHASPSAPAVRSAAAVQALPPTAAGMPTRDEIAAALRSAHQNQPEMRQPAAATPAAAPPVRQIDADELATLLKRAKGFIAIGDIASARLLLERAADAKDAGAALLLAQTYDPAVLGTPDARSITPDPAAARSWYQKAARFGSLDAQQRLAQMQN
jgi:TPR repeat protein